MTIKVSVWRRLLGENHRSSERIIVLGEGLIPGWVVCRSIIMHPHLPMEKLKEEIAKQCGLVANEYLITKPEHVQDASEDYQYICEAIQLDGPNIGRNRNATSSDR